jgi:protein involved in polysaccharide export with SLBB domain
MSQALPRDYLLGPGDVVRLDVWNRPEVSDADLRVAPDGTLNLQRIGPVQVAGKSLACVTAEIVRKLSCYYITPEVRLAVTEYRNNKAYVLGRVANPGVVEFTGRGTLLEALSLAGGLPVSNSDVELTRCALIRGRHRILWIDLGELLHGGKTALNAPLANDDVLYIPSGSEALAYVMGEVRNPGVVRMGARPLTLLDALMQAGGPTQDADLDSAYLIRFGQDRSVHRLDLEQMLEQASMTAHVRLADRDVLYLAPDGVARFNYHLRRIMPTLQILDLGTSVLEGFGVMPEVRQGVWGQEGFVDD